MADYLQSKNPIPQAAKSENKKAEKSTDSGADLIDYYRWALLLLTAVVVAAVGTWQHLGHDKAAKVTNDQGINIYRMLEVKLRCQHKLYTTSTTTEKEEETNWLSFAFRLPPCYFFFFLLYTGADYRHTEK